MALLLGSHFKLTSLSHKYYGALSGPKVHQSQTSINMTLYLTVLVKATLGGHVY